MNKQICKFSVIAAIVILIMGCSSASHTPTTPPGAQLNVPPGSATGSALGSSDTLSALNTLPIPEMDINKNNRTLLGRWTIDFDTDRSAASIESDREMAVHYNVTGLLPTPTVQFISYNPLTGIVDVNVTINNTTNIDVYNVRLIVFTNNSGILLLNEDNWTSLYDRPGGALINPFKAYAKPETKRKFAKQTQHTERLQVYIPGGSGSVAIAIDASYPGNCEEPYLIQNFTQETLYDVFDSETIVSVDVFDWQGDTDIVGLYCPQIIGAGWATFEQASSYEWQLNMVNNSGAPEGEYLGVLKANAPNSQFLYDLIIITVSQTVSQSSCDSADEISLVDTVNGNVNLDEEDWYYFYSTPKGINSGSIELTIPSGLVDIYVTGVDPGEVCPGTLLGSAINTGSTTLDIAASSYSKIYIEVIGKSSSVNYSMDVNFIREISKLNCEIYVATDDGTPTGRWPVWDVPDPDEELTLTHLNNLIDWCDYFWTIYGYRLIWDGTVTIMNAQYYNLNDDSEMWQMHDQYGVPTDYLCLYFVNQLQPPYETAYCTAIWSDPDDHISDNVITVYSPNVWYWQIVTAHEHGHAIGYYFDEYLYDASGCNCGDNSCLGYVPYLFWISDGCYSGNLMWYSLPGWTWNQYNITEIQNRYIHQFHFENPENFPFY